MSLLSLHRSQLERERRQAATEQGKIAGIAAKISRKQAELNRAKTSSQQGRLSRQLQALLEDRAQAERNLTAHQKRIGALSEKIVDEEAAERKKLARQQERAERERASSIEALEQEVAATSGALGRLDNRLAEIEVVLMERVRQAIADDPVDREHDVFLSHAGPDTEVAEELYRELTARGLDVWFDGAKIRLGEPLTRQIDRGIASSRVAAILVTEEFVKGRYWTEREMGAFISSRRRVIPILNGVDREALAKYSPLMADLVGLSTETEGFAEIAERIAAALSED